MAHYKNVSDYDKPLQNLTIRLNALMVQKKKTQVLKDAKSIAKSLGMKKVYWQNFTFLKGKFSRVGMGRYYYSSINTSNVGNIIWFRRYQKYNNLNKDFVVQAIKRNESWKPDAKTNQFANKIIEQVISETHKKILRNWNKV